MLSGEKMSSVELWKCFVDEFAQLHDGVFEKWVLQEGSYPNRQENSEINEFLTSLTVQQREILVKMLINARRGGIHDALVRLNDRMDCENGQYYENGIEMEFQPFGSTLYYDYVCRREGDNWEQE
ncbi:MAG TPA: hypothetical protein DCY70_06880 [Shewanella sp.]|nr:hypothetical protein [Shewanella sp.]